MRKNTNQEVIEGYLYQHSLQLKQVKNEKSPNFGKDFISGTLDVATDEACLNVLSVHYTYVTEFTKTGSKNATYAALKRIYDDPKTILTDGKEGAVKVKLSPSAALNEFYPNGQDEVVSQQINEGGFVTIINGFDIPEAGRQKFTFDMLVTHFRRIDADPERNITEDYAEIKGAIFNFRNDLLPFTVTVRNPEAIQYFEGLEVSEKNPVYINLWGKIVSSIKEVKNITKSVFGEDAVDITQRKIREWVVMGAREPYVFNDPSTITTEELAKAIQDRNVMLATIKKNRDEYEKNKNAGSSFGGTDNATVPVGGFNF